MKTFKEFENIINEFITNDTFLKLKEYKQHFNTSRFDHCYMAAYYCFIICKKLNLDYKSATRAAMLHDFFLYDLMNKGSRARFHTFRHGKIACQNALQFFKLNRKEQNIIARHMWPVTIIFPSSVEGFILTFVDKYCAIKESLEMLKLHIYSKNFFRYAYLFLGLFIFNIKQI